jgi:hypothetical protein
MENLLDTNVQSSQNFQLDAYALDHLNETRKWTFFISIVGFVFMGLGILALFGVMIFAGSFGGAYSASPALALIPLLIIVAIYFFPIYFLLLFSRNAKLAVQNSDPNALTNALKYLKFHYRFMGILLIIIVGIYFLVFLIAALTGGIASMMH